MALKHSFTSAIANDPTAAAAGEVLPSHWNADHVVDSGGITFSDATVQTTAATGTNTGDQTTISGNAGTATALQTARTIGGVSFDGTANITVASATGGFTVSGGTLNSADHIITSSSATAFAVGPTGITNPAFSVNASTASGVTGIQVINSATGNAQGAVLQATSSAANENITLRALGTGITAIDCQTGGSILIRNNGNTRATFNSSQALFDIAGVSNTAANIRFRVVNAADAALQAGVNAVHTHFNLASATRTHATGNITLQEDFVVSGTQHIMAAGGGTVTDMASFAINTGIAGNLCTATNYHGIYVPSTSVVTGTGVVTNSYAATFQAQTGATNNFSTRLDGAISLGSSNPGTAGQVLTSAGSNAQPTWTAAPATAVSVTTANGFAGSSSGGTTPSLTLSTTITGILQGNGTAISAATTTGSGSVVLATSPTLITPNIGVATATTVNKVTLTAPTTGSTLTIADGKTLTSNVTATFAGTDGNTYTLPNVAAATLATISTLTQTFTGSTTFSSTFTVSGSTATIGTGTGATTYGLGTGATLTATTKTVNIGTSGVSGSTTNTNIGSAIAGSTNTTTVQGTTNLAALTASTSLALDSSKNIVSVTNTGTGNAVLATSPTLVTPVLGAATGTSLNLSGLTASSAVATDGSKNLVSVATTGTGNYVLATSPTLVTPTLGAANATSINFGGSTLSNYVASTSFTPVAIGSTLAGAGTYVAQAGTYTRIGDRVFFDIELGWSAHTGTGNLQISGLPIANAGTVGTSLSIGDYSGLTTLAAAQLTAVILGGSQVIGLYYNATGVAATAVPMDVNVTQINISGSYRV